ncbi:MAG: hypothetical protein K6G27_02415, partial [Lachnospiraceae bacterium]|nr:hypothetical protein [Lachnospiraceae bacterium]
RRVSKVPLAFIKYLFTKPSASEKRLIIKYVITALPVIANIKKLTENKLINSIKLLQKTINSNKVNQSFESNV